jgi:hypothetical protein
MNTSLNVGHLERQEKVSPFTTTHTHPRDHVALVTSRSGIVGQPGASLVLLHRRTLAKVLLRRAAKGHAGRWYGWTARRSYMDNRLTDCTTGHFTATQWNEQAKAYMPNPEMVHSPPNTTTGNPTLTSHSSHRASS